jgi:hypothetical protein
VSGRQDLAQIGPWIVLRKIGTGGFGAVYAARHRDRPDLVRAVKWLMNPTRNGLARLKREAELLARIDHPGIVRVHEIGEQDASAFLVMDLIQGESLRNVIERAPQGLPHERAFEIAVGIAHAMAAAHAGGVVHRDLKPENILIDETGAPRVIDFGLALANDLDRLTATGVGLGTLSYMPPEQLEGRRSEQGPWTDVYSLGAILYELLTGAPAFSGTQMALVRKIATSEYAPASTIRSDLPEATDSLIARCLTAGPRQRFRDAKQFARAVGDLRSGELARAERSARRGRFARLVLPPSLVLAAAIGGVWTLRVLERRADRELERIVAEAGRLVVGRATRDEIDALVSRHDALLATRWLRRSGGDREATIAALERRLHALDLGRALHSSDDAAARNASIDLLAEASDDAAVASAAWTEFTARLPASPSERLGTVEVLIQRAPHAVPRVRREVARVDLEAIASLDDRSLRDQALGRLAESAPGEYAVEAVAWCRRALDANAADLERSLVFARSLRDHFPPKGDTQLRNELAREGVELILARATKRRDADAFGAIGDRIDAFLDDPTVPAPAWYVAFVERLAFERDRALAAAGGDESRAKELQRIAFLEVMAEDVLWGVPQSVMTNVTVSKPFSESSGNRAFLLDAAQWLAARAFPLLIDDVAVRNELAHWEDVPRRYRQLARSLARRALALKGDLPAERQTDAARAAELTAKVIAEDWLRVSAWGSADWSKSFAATTKTLDEIEALDRRDLERIEAAAKDNPDPLVTRSVALAKLRLAAVLETWGWVFESPLYRWAIDESPAAVDARRDLLAPIVVAKSAESLALCREAGAQDFRMMEVAQIAVLANTAAQHPDRALELFESTKTTPSYRAITADLDANVFGAAYVFKLHLNAAVADLASSPRRIDAAERECKLCEQLLAHTFSFEEEMNELTASLHNVEAAVANARNR